MRNEASQCASSLFNVAGIPDVSASASTLNHLIDCCIGEKLQVPLSEVLEISKRNGDESCDPHPFFPCGGDEKKQKEMFKSADLKHSQSKAELDSSSATGINDFFQVFSSRVKELERFAQLMLVMKACAENMEKSGVLASIEQLVQCHNSMLSCTDSISRNALSGAQTRVLQQSLNSNLSPSPLPALNIQKLQQSSIFSRSSALSRSSSTCTINSGNPSGRNPGVVDHETGCQLTQLPPGIKAEKAQKGRYDQSSGNVSDENQSNHGSAKMLNTCMWDIPDDLMVSATPVPQVTTEKAPKLDGLGCPSIDQIKKAPLTSADGWDVPLEIAQGGASTPPLNAVGVTIDPTLDANPKANSVSKVDILDSEKVIPVHDPKKEIVQSPRMPDSTKKAGSIESHGAKPACKPTSLTREGSQDPQGYMRSQSQGMGNDIARNHPIDGRSWNGGDADGQGRKAFGEVKAEAKADGAVCNERFAWGVVNEIQGRPHGSTTGWDVPHKDQINSARENIDARVAATHQKHEPDYNGVGKASWMDGSNAEEHSGVTKDPWSSARSRCAEGVQWSLEGNKSSGRTGWGGSGTMDTTGAWGRGMSRN